MATSTGSNVFGEPNATLNAASVYTQIVNKEEGKFLSKAPYLGKHYTAIEVAQATKEDSIWGETGGALFEASEGADIDGCYPGNFKTIDSVKTDAQGMKWGISLKVMHDPSSNTFINKMGGYVKELVEFAYDKRNLVLKGGGSKQVEVNIRDLDRLLLKVGVPDAFYKLNGAELMKYSATFTYSTLGGTHNSALNRMGKYPDAHEVPIKTEFVSAPDHFFARGQGELYEELKGADIHGKPPGSFMTIDKLKKDKKRIVSFKARDILANYTGQGGLARLAKQLKEDIDDLATFKKHTDNLGRTVDGSAYEERRLSWAIPFLTLQQLEAFHDVFNHAFYYAAKMGVFFRIHMVA